MWATGSLWRVSRPARTTRRVTAAADLCLRRLDAASGNSSSDSTPWSPVAPVAKDLEWKITSLDSLALSLHLRRRAATTTVEHGAFLRGDVTRGVGDRPPPALRGPCGESRPRELPPPIFIVGTRRPATKVVMGHLPRFYVENDPHVTAHTGEFAKGMLHRDLVPRVDPDSQYAVGTRDQVPRVAPDSQYAVGTRDQVPRVAPDSQSQSEPGT
ncbi:hypothetical protein THAOC_13057 [Thalassiosira oceanica]|uniref:Uncharacterized protein n=1 Tax=Thalassiosira oceanica TaxID=159749 RepID=K0SM54_THAOC|nr:hypothetical protein THAOC_13057 [Thalassiosira oceanica]|eukprot:EJK66049.1 hypothetical protein THAOC_13057 [Thalassiosira oceanica]